MVEQSLDDGPHLTNVVNEHGHSALFVAAACGHLRTTKRLLRVEGIDVNQSSMYRRTPLFAAVYRGHHEIVAALLTHPDIDVNRPDIYGRTPLHVAAICGWTQESFLVAQALMSHPDIRVNVKDLRGHTPLHLAIRHLGFTVMPVLLQAPNIDLTAKNKQGFTAQMIAETFGHLTLAEAIERAARKQRARKNNAVFKCAVKLIILGRRTKHAMYAPGGPGARAALARLQKSYMNDD
jgi:ankyrin repeat protein